MVLAEIHFVLDVLLKAGVVLVEQPAEYSLLDFLVVLFLEEIVLEKLNGPENEKLTIPRTGVKRTNWAVRRKRNRPARQDGLGGCPHIQCRTVWVDKLEATILVTAGKFILVVFIAFGVLASLLGWLLGFALCNAHQFFIEDTVPDVCLFRVQVLVEGLSDHGVSVAADANLLKHRVDIGLQLVLAALAHHNDYTAAIFDVSADILQLLGREWQSWSAQKQQIALSELFDGQVGLVDLTLGTNKNG